ncbi:glycosyltransferase [uncultured Bacteroides sp.]|uniref:glycosyltransferase n=1 Tax=uncultured Bacteroides sp. TaxID=162156 RepID=UPI0025875CA4|nr:glycosyltransferase [uncultured Bacteroides sp.]
MNLISVIIPIYKIKEELLRECLNSISLQKLKNLEIILIDDGSPDNSGKICDEYAENDNRIKVIHQKNQGVSVARNVGINNSNSEWITFIDPDDWIEANWSEVLFETINNTAADIIMFDYYQEFATKQNPQYLKSESGYLSENYLHAIKIAPFNQLIINNKFQEYETNVIWNKVYRTKLIKENNITFDPEARKGQDVIFNAEILQLTSNIFYIHKTLYHYRYLQESITNRYNPKVRFYNEIAFKHYERIIERYSLTDEYKEAFYARVLTRLYSCMRLYYFHENNTMKYKDIKNELDNILNSYPYNISLDRVNKKYLNYPQRLFVYILQKRYYRLLRFMVKSRIWIRKIFGKKLKY